MNFRKSLKGIAPKVLLEGWFSLKERWFLSNHLSSKDRFSEIYRANIWQNSESASGFGSTYDATTQIRGGLEQLISEYRITSILDAPCGDYNWMRHLKYDGAYTGVDIVPELIDQNIRQFGGAGVSFECLDICQESLPSAGLVLSRECLNHLSLAQAAKALDNLKRSTDGFLLITHYPDHDSNEDQETSFRYRRLNLEKPPFNLGTPFRSISESAWEDGKTIGIWSRESLL